MSRSLGINVKVDFGEAMRQLDAFEKRWEKLGKEPVKLKVKVDDGKIESLEKTVKKLNSLDNKGINLNVKTDKAMSNLRELKSRFESVKNEIEKCMDINIGSNRTNYKGMDSAAKNSQSLMSGMQSADKASRMIVQSYKEAGGLASRFVRLNSQGLNDVKSGYKSMTETRVSGAKKSLQIARDEKASLKDIAKLTTEIGRLNVKSVGKSAEEQAVITKRIKERTNALEEMTKAHEKSFGKSANDDWSVKAAQDLAKYNIELKQASVNAKALKKSESGQGTSFIKEQKAAYNDLRKSISRTNQLKEKLSTSGANEANAINDAIAAEKRRENAIRQSISAKQLYNKEIEREITKSEELQSERRQENNAMNQGSKMDRSPRGQRGYTGVFTDVLDPTRYYHEGKQAAMMMYESVATLDEQMTNIEKVADVPSETLARFSKDIFKQASAVSKSADEYAVSVERWLTSGKGFEESQRLAAVSSIGGFVGNIGEEDMVRYMSVPLNSFKNEALEAEDIINSMNEVSNNNAIEMTELGKAYERASQTASNAGTSFSELTGMVTGAQEATRAGGEKIGTALKAIDINFGAMMAGATKESTKRKAFFKEIGVEIDDGNGKLRSTYDIVGDLAGKWDNLSDEQRNLATTYAAGKNHAAILQSLVTGWDDVTKATAEAQGQMGLMEDGSAYHEFEKQQQSVKAKAVELKNSWTELLVTIAGGREGVNGVLDILKDIVDAGVKFANNDFAMKLAGGLAKIVAASAGLVGVNKLFRMISAGAQDAALFTGRLATSTGRMMKYTNKKGRAQLKAEREQQNIALVKEGKQPKVGFAKSFKGAKGISKAGVLIGGLSRGIGSLVPIIGGVTMALSVLDAMGLDVWGGMGKMVDKVAKKFEGAEKKAKKVNNEFSKAQNEHKKEISENKFLNGAVERNSKELKSYKELVSAKKKAYEAGETNSLSFSPEEFSHLKSQAEKLSKELGINIDLEMNDYDHIISQFEKIEKYQNKIAQKDMEKGVKKIGEVSEKKDMKDSLKAWGDKKDEAQRQLENLEARVPFVKAEMEANRMSQDSVKELEGMIAEAKAAKADLENYFNTQYTKEEKKADDSKRRNVNELRNDHGSQLESGNLNFEGMEETEVKNGMTTMVSYTKKVQEEGNAIKKARDDIQQAYDKWNGVNGQTQDKNARVSKETFEQMKKLFPDMDEKFNTNVDSWGEGFDETAINRFNQATKESQQRTDNLKVKLQELAASGKVGEAQFNEMTKALNGSNKEFVEYMMNQGEVGTSMLGISDTLMATRPDWKELVLDMQSQLEGVDMEKAIKLKIATEDGLINGEAIDDILGIPEEIQSEFSIINKEGDIDIQKTMDALTKLEESEFSAAFKIEGGGIDFEKLTEYWGGLDDKGKKEFLASFEIEGEEEATKAKEVSDSLEDKKATIKVEGEVKNIEELKKSQEVVNEIDGETATVTVTANDESHQVVVDAKGNILSVDGLKATAVLDADGNVSYKVITAKGEIISLNSIEGIGKLDANDDPVTTTVNGAKATVEGMNTVTGEATIDGNDQPLRTTIGGISSIPVPSVSVLLTGVMDSLLSGFFGGGKSGSATVSVKGKKEKSVGILDRNMAKSFSQSVSSVVGASQSKPTKGRSYSKSSSDNKPINSDVWRYWGKELFKGLPLERSMENLENAIKKAGENYDKLIPLYKQQISLMNQQIAFQKTMQKETQSELNEVLGKLRGKGFKTKGNQITNLDRAKAFKGESASEVEELLNKWKSLYEGLDEITGKINSLNQQKWDVEQDIKNAQIDKEAKALEDRLKKTTALLTAIESHMSILSKKEGLVSDSDYELKLTVQEESANDAKRNIGMLVDEFNKLSATTIKYGENADTVKSELESLKSEILNNADAILDYRESMNQLRVERLIQDYDKFNETISRNTSLLEGNVEALKEGLVSGTKISDLESSKLQNLLFDRKSALDKQYEDRLQLESKIDAVLEAFSKKNVDRAKGVANAQLQIEKKKYEELLKMEKDYSNGKTPSYKEIGGKFDLGTMVEQTSSNDKGYAEWLENMKKVNNQYVSDFAKMRDEFEKSMDKAGTQAEKDKLTNKFIIDQLKLQEKIQNDIVKANNEAIALAEKELENATLTTEQRQELEEAILEYRDSSVDAQEEIRKIIEDRFDFEFDLIDKAADKASKYSDTLEHLLDVSNLVGRNSKDKQNLVDKIYESKANEYYNAKKALLSLQEQQSKFVEGSLEWNLLQEKIEDVDKSLKDLTVSLLEANKKVLENRVEAIEDTFTKGVLDGKTLDQWRNFRDRWATGIEKEVELEKIRQRLLAMESDVNKERLEVLDRQEAVSKKELEYLDKQTKVLELQDKINNLDKERDVQTLVKNEDGTWDWEYQADQTEIDKAKEDLANAEKDLEAFKQEQREKYASDIQKVLNDAKDGKFETTDDLRKELEDVRNAYGEILNSIPNINEGSMEEILAAYDNFLKENGLIIDDALNGGSDTGFDDKLVKIGGMFESSFRAIAEDLGKVISDALSNALGLVTGVKRVSGEQPFVIQNQELVFPSVIDTTGFEEVLLDLPQTAQQKINSK